MQVTLLCFHDDEQRRRMTVRMTLTENEKCPIIWEFRAASVTFPGEQNILVSILPRLDERSLQFLSITRCLIRRLTTEFISNSLVIDHRRRSEKHRVIVSTIRSLLEWMISYNWLRTLNVNMLLVWWPWEFHVSLLKCQLITIDSPLLSIEKERPTTSSSLTITIYAWNWISIWQATQKEMRHRREERFRQSLLSLVTLAKAKQCSIGVQTLTQEEGWLIGCLPRIDFQCGCASRVSIDSKQSRQRRTRKGLFFSSRKMSVQKSDQHEECEQLLLLSIGLLRWIRLVATRTTGKAAATLVKVQATERGFQTSSSSSSSTTLRSVWGRFVAIRRETSSKTRLIKTTDVSRRITSGTSSGSVESIGWRRRWSEIITSTTDSTGLIVGIVRWHDVRRSGKARWWLE